jgi:hypothetical protein
MNSPRIYLYKVTFEEVPHWYWGIHKEKKFGETYLGSPTTHRWMWDFYTPEIEILQLFPFNEEGWSEAHDVEERVIKPDLDNSLCLNEACGGKISLTARSLGGKKISLQQQSENGKKGAVVLNLQKDERGRSINALKGAMRAKEMGVGLAFLTMEQRVKAGKKGGRIGGKKAATTLYVDPNHPELGAQNAGNLVKMQRKRNLPSGPENRVKVTK